MIESTTDTLDYEFDNPELLQEALTHASSADARLESNERLEFLGDSVLGFVVCEYLFNTYPDLLEGELTKIKSSVVSRTTCAKVSQSARFAHLLTLGKGVSPGSELPTSIAAAVFESLIAAIYLDGGMDAARAFVIRHLKPHIEEAEASNHQRNFKSVLQHFAQKHLPTPPEYVLMAEKGPDHDKEFQVCVSLCDRTFEPAWAASKKEAEQRAALHALREVGLVVDDDSNGSVDLHPEKDYSRIAAELIGEAE